MEALESSWEPLQSPHLKHSHSRWGTGSYRWSCSPEVLQADVTLAETDLPRIPRKLSFWASCFQQVGLLITPCKMPSLMLTAVLRTSKSATSEPKPSAITSAQFPPSPHLETSHSHGASAVQTWAQSTASKMPRTHSPALLTSLPPEAPAPMNGLGSNCSHFLLVPTAMLPELVSPVPSCL